jgi:hypothetical protein
MPGVFTQRNLEREGGREGEREAERERQRRRKRRKRRKERKEKREERRGRKNGHLKPEAEIEMVWQWVSKTPYWWCFVAADLGNKLHPVMGSLSLWKRGG